MSAISFSSLATWASRVASCFRKFAISAGVAGFTTGLATGLLRDGFWASPTCEIALPRTSPRLSLVHTFLVFLRSAGGEETTVCESCWLELCEESCTGGDGESCDGKAGNREDAAAGKADSKAAAATIILRVTQPEYQGSAFAESALPNSARMACNASLGGPIRRYCE